MVLFDSFTFLLFWSVYTPLEFVFLLIWHEVNFTSVNLTTYQNQVIARDNNYMEYCELYCSALHSDFSPIQFHKYLHDFHSSVIFFPVSGAIAPLLLDLRSLSLQRVIKSSSLSLVGL